ncbi:acyl-CoA dehydrogenase family protein [Sphingobium sp. HWE2-09]|uniref:acyl-CoA dehydrogenase family protein n=1 Tax=Sphingobium sp. HWE2-09 TaxID=3108390 RepID=UPI002DCF37BF|nr:acyl-CoA dehydrogenase family protein [Sphingobium sp. HWE2-09]
MPTSRHRGLTRRQAVANVQRLAATLPFCLHQTEVHLSLSHLDLFRVQVSDYLQDALTSEMRQAPRTIMLLDVDLQQAWHRRLAQKGWAVPNWPVEHGGTGWSREELAVFQEELVAASAPPLSPNLQMIGPVLMAFGTPEQQERHLPSLRSGEILWCQGYSEPGAGSDLAALQTRAVQDGDDYIVNGQKIWTSYAHVADWMFCLVRTSTEGKRQAGISFLLIDMKTPGITVRPIWSIDGLHHFNEVFFNDVRIPVTNRIGAENGGWNIAKYLLEHERNGVADTPYLRMRLRKVKDVARQSPDDLGSGSILLNPVFARRLLKAEIDLLALECLSARAASAEDDASARLSSALKLRGSEVEQEIAELGRLALACTGRLDQSDTLKDSASTPIGSPGGPEVMLNYLNGRAATIYGGSSEIQRGIIFKQLRLHGV